ncbi:phosphopyruvate hydratase [Patescibacteria group bacterium AH-259-L05]|nr:phosphopyruvate hydratase [Patescibacteria group bacterium AH-259-L05]
MAKIKQVFAREILDSRGNPTVEANVMLDNGISAKAAVPSGASTGKYEALELRDKDPNRFYGKGVLGAIKNITEIIAPAILGKEANPQDVDNIMIALDGTNNKSRLGANAILAVSLALARAAARSQGLPLYKYIRQAYDIPSTSYRLPTPLFNVINGGKHSDSGLDIQEFMIIPMKGDSFGQKVQTGVEVFSALREVLEKRGLTFAVGDEGGFAPKLKNTKKVFDLLVSISEFSKHSLGDEIFFGLDIAASVFYDETKKYYMFGRKRSSSADMAKLYYHWFKRYPLALIEDPFAEDDWEAWTNLTKKITTLNEKFLVVGDDLLATNVERLEKGITSHAANAILVKVNQIGTLTETMKCIDMAQDNNYQVVISHRSGETNDTFIADLAVAVDADYIKAGAPNRGERVAKYNRLMEIENELK